MMDSERDELRILPDDPELAAVLAPLPGPQSILENLGN